MREVELTISILESLEEVLKKLEDQGFEFVEKYYMRDYYMAHKSIDLTLDNYKILSKCLLIREIVDDNPKKQLVYKNKTYAQDGKIISQNKFKTNIDSIDKVKQMLEIVDFITLFEVENNSYIYKKDNTEVVIQKITNPEGLYMEIEATEEELQDPNDENIKTILKEKLDNLGLKTTGEYEVKKAFIALDKVKKISI
ncbi:MAG: hypothetical protein GX265_00815 [Mollicutes bacterium]|nr:hypothetical protein [Mollicutes bacterium]